MVEGSSALHSCVVALVSVLPRRDTRTSSWRKKTTPEPSASRSKRGSPSVKSNHRLSGGARIPCPEVDIDEPGNRLPVATGILREVAPAPRLTMLVVAEEPQSTTGTLADIGSRPVTGAMFADPWTNDRNLHAEPVGHFGEDLDVFQVVCEIYIRAIVGLYRARPIICQRQGGDCLLQDLGIPRLDAGHLADDLVNLRVPLEVPCARRPQDRRERGLPGITLSPGGDPAVHRDRPLYADGLSQLPVEVSPRRRGGDGRRWLGTGLWVYPLVLVKP